MRSIQSTAIFFIMLLLNSYAFGFGYQTDRLKNFFGFYLDSLSLPHSESLMLAKADSMNIIDEFPRFRCYPSVGGRGYFCDLSCVCFYSIRTCSNIPGPGESNKLIFFNICDGSIYHYGGDIDAFNSVFRNDLSENYNPDFALELLGLYLNTLYTPAPYSILKNGTEFVSIVDSLYMRVDDTAPGKSIKDKIESEKQFVLKIIEPLKIEQGEGYLRISFHTFGGLKNWLEKWVFDIYPDHIEIRERKIIYENLGPLEPYHH